MSQRQRVFLDVSIGTQPAGRITIELFNDKTPRTCENFRQLCIGSTPPLTYKSSRFHRVIDEFMIQGGDTTKGDGSGGASYLGGEFEDENLDWRPIDSANLVCMANRGKNTNSSQFFISLANCEHLNGKHTVFGHVVAGQQTLERIAKLDVDDDDCPKEDVIVSHCGELERRKKVPATTASGFSTPGYSSDDRGRKRRHRSISRDRRSKSRSSSRDGRGARRDTSRTPSISPKPPQKRDRRRSDAELDETRRGRVRKQSPRRKDRSPPPTIKEGREGERSDRPPRGPSPSRDPRRREEELEDYRRRRSLPNQYERRREHEGYRGGQDRRRDDRDRRGGGRYNDNFNHDRGGGGQYGGRPRDDNSGRLGAEDFGDDSGSGTVKLKGRGMMKYRER